MKKILIITLFLCFTSGLFAQIDQNNIEETDAFQYQPNNSNVIEMAPQNSDKEDIKAETITCLET